MKASQQDDVQAQGFLHTPPPPQQQQQYYGQYPADHQQQQTYYPHHHHYHHQHHQQQYHQQYAPAQHPATQYQPPQPYPVVGVAVPPPSYASAGYLQQAPPQPQTGAVIVEYESRGCCSQPRRGSVSVKCDGVTGCSLSQGATSSFIAPAGMHKFVVSTDNVVEKFFRGLFGGDEDRGPQTIGLVRPNGRLVLRVRWDSNGCCSSKYHLVISTVQ